ncbi:down syndrome cell adhesion molecule, partial [Trichonephila inaurata madagascariensis]
MNVVTTTHTTIQVQWEIRSSSSSPIEGFHLHYKRELGGWQEIQVPSNKREHTFENLQCGTRYHFYMTAFNEVGEGLPSDAVTAKTLGVGGNTLPPVIKRPAPFYTNLAIVAPVVVTVIILISVLIVVCALSRRRRNGDRQYEDAQSVRKEMNTEAVQMSEYEVKQDGTYVQAKDSSLYFPSPYATSRVPVFSLDERSSGESSTDGRSTLHDIERPYDVPFAVKQ